MKLKKTAALFLTLVILTALGCGILSASGDDTTITGSDSSGLNSSTMEVSYTIPTGYTVTIPARLSITSQQTTAAVSGSATLPTNRQLCVVLNHSTSGTLTNTQDSSKTLGFTVSTSDYQGADIPFKDTNVPEYVTNAVGSTNNVIKIGGVRGDTSPFTFSTNLVLSINSTDGLPAGTYSKTLTFYTWVQDIPGVEDQ